MTRQVLQADFEFDPGHRSPNSKYVCDTPCSISRSSGLIVCVYPQEPYTYRRPLYSFSESAWPTYKLKTIIASRYGEGSGL